MKSQIATIILVRLYYHVNVLIRTKASLIFTQSHGIKYCKYDVKPVRDIFDVRGEIFTVTMLSLITIFMLG